MAPKAPTVLSTYDVSYRIAAVLKVAGIEALITHAKVSAHFPDGAKALYVDLEIDTRKCLAP